MDGNKNKIPRWSCAFAMWMKHMTLSSIHHDMLLLPSFHACSFIRPVKDISDALRDTIKLRIAGVIIHARTADHVHVFPVAPNLAGNANLNCEC
eukprot:1739354-Pleurochrysis_carterae.AAC.1